MTTTKGPTMSDTPNILRHLATLLDGLPGIPEPLVIVQPKGWVTVAFHESAGSEFARDGAVDALMVLVGGVAQPQWPADHIYGGTVEGWHGRTLHVESHRARVGAVA